MGAFSDDERNAAYAPYRAFARGGRGGAACSAGGSELGSTARHDNRSRQREQTLVTDARTQRRPNRSAASSSVECASLDPRVDWAARVPAPAGAVEVRPPTSSGGGSSLSPPLLVYATTGRSAGTPLRGDPAALRATACRVGRALRGAGQGRPECRAGARRTLDGEGRSLRDGARIVTDGPFAETKEIVGGPLPPSSYTISTRRSAWPRSRRRRESGRSRSARFCDDERNAAGRRACLPRGMGAAVAPHTRPRRPRARRGRVQDAFATALERWPRDGLPRTPGAWIVTTARNRAIDRIRREKVFQQKAELIGRLQELPGRGGRRERDPRRAARARLHVLPPALARGRAASR